VPPAAPRIGVIGNGREHATWDAQARTVGQEIAKRGGLLVCGGLSGVMAAAAQGAQEEGGLTLGILPGSDSREANSNIAIPIPTGLGEGRNLIVVQASQALIAIGGGAGTLSEIGFALKLRKPLILLGSWQIAPPTEQDAPVPVPQLAGTPQEAVELAFKSVPGTS